MRTAENVSRAKAKQLIESRRYCLSLTRQHARSFYFASFALPRAKKVAAFAVYGFCRYVDDLVDEMVGGAQAVETVQLEFDRFVDDPPTEPFFAPAFSEAVRTYRIPKQPFLDLTRGVLMDSGPVRIKTWSELRDYCYYVASVVGIIMCHIFELQDEAGLARAVDLGIAMQLTNILRDISEDAQRDRIYLPKDELEQFGVTIQQIGEKRLDDRFCEMMRFQIARARRYYRQAEPGIPLLKDDGSQLTVWIMRFVYAGILEEIEMNRYNVFDRRASTPFLKKIGLARRAYGAYRAANSMKANVKFA